MVKKKGGKTIKKKEGRKRALGREEGPNSESSLKASEESLGCP